jgi:hypothetical protein
MAHVLVIGGPRTGKTVLVCSLVDATRSRPLKVWPADEVTAAFLKDVASKGRPDGTRDNVNLAFTASRVAHRR